MLQMPNSVCWNITKYCNDNCLFCYRDKISEDVSSYQKKIIIEKIATSGIKKLTFAGGEPLLIPELPSLIKFAKSNGLIVSLTTNGILLNGELLDFCLENLDWLTLSLDGATADIQNAMTRNSNHLKTVLEILDYSAHYKNKKCKIKINTMVSRINQGHILEIADIVTCNSVSRWKLFQFVPLRGNDIEFKNNFFISDDEFKQVVHKTREYLHGKDIFLSISGRNNIESAYFVIFPNGDIKISTKLEDIVLGNALIDNLKKIWENGNYCRELHEERTGFINNREK